MFNRLIGLISQTIYMRNQIGGRQFLRYLLTKADQEIVLQIQGHGITVRRGTPDLSVAISCLNGEFEVCEYLLPRDYAGVIVDAGGYIGTATVAIRSMFPAARIIVVEPSLENLSVLRKNVDGLEGVEIVHGALTGEQTDSIELKNRQTGAWGYSVVETAGDNRSADVIDRVPGLTLGQLVDNVGDIGLLKLDIEGSEVSLMQHDRSTLDQIPFIFAELHERIVPGCDALFFDFSKTRVVVKSGGEKYLSIRT